MFVVQIKSEIEQVASHIAKILVEGEFSVDVNIVPGARYVYKLEGRV